MDAESSVLQAGGRAYDQAEEEAFREVQEDDDVDDDNSADGAIEFLRAYTAQQESAQQHVSEKEWLSGEHWSFAAACPSDLPGGAAAAVAMMPTTLQALVERLVLPGRATDDSNNICAAIMLHPDLLKSPSVLSQYSKMNGGLRNYSTGTAHAWLYTPRKQPSRTDDSDLDHESDNRALVFVYPDAIDPSAGDDGDDAKPKNKLHFGGRAYPLCNNSVLLQHGAHKPLGCAF